MASGCQRRSGKRSVWSLPTGVGTALADVQSSAPPRNPYRQGAAKVPDAVAQVLGWTRLVQGAILLPKPQVEGPSPFARSICRRA